MNVKNKAWIISLHNYLSQESFYPLFLSSTLAVVIYIARVILGHSWNYINLMWNLVLAWIPYLASLAAFALFRKNPQRWMRLILPGLVWLIFFPNAPYMLTDFLHLQPRPYIPMWYDILLLATFAWTGCFLAIVSLRSMQFMIRRYLGWVVSWVFALAALAMSSLGIFLGRFERWNSWDLLIQPKEVFKDLYTRILNPFDNLGFVGFTGLVTAFLIVCYLTFASIKRYEDPQKTKPERGGQA